MRPVALLASATLACLALCVPATGAAAAPGSRVDAPETGRDAMWIQLPGDGLVISSQYDYCYPFYSECADDFMCGDESTVLRIEWWGNYWPFTGLAEYFVFRVYDDLPGPTFNRPGALIYEDSSVEYSEEYDPVYALYRYAKHLPVPLTLETGEIYWLSVQAVLCFPPHWGWAACDPEYHWGAEAVMDHAELGIPRWTLMTTAVGAYYEMSFALYGTTASGVESLEHASWGRIKSVFR